MTVSGRGGMRTAVTVAGLGQGEEGRHDMQGVGPQGKLMPLHSDEADAPDAV